MLFQQATEKWFVSLSEMCKHDYQVKAFCIPPKFVAILHEHSSLYRWHYMEHYANAKIYIMWRSIPTF